MRKLERYIDKLHIRSFDKILKRVQQDFPDATKEQVQEIVDKRIKDPYNVGVKQIKYMNKLFSNHIGNWQMDLIDNKDEFDVKYWYVFVNVNSKYACAYTLSDKRTDSIIAVLRLFIRGEQYVSSLTGDCEGGWSSNACVEFLKDKKITLRLIQDKQHTSLAVVDRLIRTLRDMNIPVDKNVRVKHKSKKYSDDKKYFAFSEHRMGKLITSYNKTYHDEIKMAPKDMHDDIELESKYIRNCLGKQVDVENTKGYELKTFEYVRILLDKETFKKHRYRVSREYYMITGQDGKLYDVQARDGTIKKLPRWKIIGLGLIEPNAPENMLMGKSFKDPKHKGRDTFEVIELVSKKGETYKARVRYPSGDEGTEEITAKSLSAKYPQILSQMEKRYLKKYKK